MADAPDADAKTEAPSPKRRREAAERGEVWQSRELGVALGVGSGVAWCALCGATFVAGCARVVAIGLDIRPGQGADIAALLGPVAVPIVVLAVLVPLALVAGPLLLGAPWSPGAAAPKPSRVDPLAGLKRMAGTQGLVELAKALLKAGVVGGAGWAVLGGGAGIFALGAGDVGGTAARVGDVALSLLWALVLALAGIAAIDLPWQRMRWLAKLRMTRQEVRDESRESDGAPETRAARARLARAAARRALRPALAEATVVTINPSEFAVALRYVPGRDAAPVLVARGQGVIAAAIRDLAAERRVPVLRYPPLTRALFFTGRLGQPIRDDLYGPVAAVLAFVFSLDAEVGPPAVVVPASARFDEHGKPA